MTAREQRREYHPEVGEVVALNGFDSRPWALVLGVASSEAFFALLEQTETGYDALPDSYTRQLEKTVGDREARREVADAAGAEDGVDTLSAPLQRLEPLGEPHIQGCEPPEDD